MTNLNHQINQELIDGKNNELIESMLKSLTALNNEVNLKRIELEKLKNKIKEGKFNYNQEIKIYQKLNQEIIFNEQKKGNIENNISKIKKKQLILYSTFSKEFLQNLIDSFKKFKSIFIHFINFSGYSPEKEINFISIILRDEHELKYIIEHSHNYQNNLFEKSKELFYKIKNKINIFKEQNSIPYPFESIFENMENIYKIIDLNNDKNEINNDINKKIEEKNKIFLTLKKIEGIIVNNEKLYQEMKNYIKGINSILDNYQTIRKKNDISNYLKFAKSVTEFNKVNFSEQNTNFSNSDININSMTLQSEFSEDKNDYNKQFLKNKNNLTVKNTMINNFNLNKALALDKNINKIILSKTHSKTTSRTTSRKKSPNPIHKLKKKKNSKSKTPNLSYIKENNSKTPFRKINKVYNNNYKKYSNFPLNNIIQKTVIKKKIIKEDNSSDNEKTERNDIIINNLIRNDLMINDTNDPFTNDNDSVCDEVSPLRQDKFKISSLVIKNENGKICPIINRGIKQQNNFNDLRIDRKVYSNECCMSCT